LREPPHVKKKLCTHFTDEEVARALGFGPTDVLVLHEWPRGAIQAEQAATVGATRKEALKMRFCLAPRSCSPSSRAAVHRQGA
jgi:hypothetical protein